LNTIRVLLVAGASRDRTICRQAVDGVTQWHVVWHEADSISQGSTALRESSFDCIVVDRTLPDGDGLTLLDEARQRIAPPAVVVITDRVDENSGVIAIQNGAQDYVNKDEIGKNLGRSIRYALERQRLEDRLRKATERLLSLSEHDELTGLLNRRGLDTAMSLEGRRAKREGTAVIGLLIDLDDFKLVNDQHGHAVGDKVIRQVARQLLLACRVTDHAARVGGDEFALVLPDVTLAEARNVAERIRLLVNNEPVRHNGIQIKASVSIGIAPIPPEGLNTTALLKQCRFALRHSKSGGRNRVSLSSTARRPSRSNMRELTASQVQRAFVRRPLRVHAAPIVELENGRVVAREYTLRTTESANITVDELFANALNEGNLVGIDLDYFRIRLDEAETGDRRPCHLSLFPETVLSEHIEEIVAPLMRFCRDGEIRVGLTAGLIPVEHGMLESRIEQLRKAGARLEILDIGGSRGALDGVVALHPDFVRLSADLIADIDQTSRARQVLRIVRLLKALGCTVIADDVQTDVQRRALLGVGVRLGTGAIAENTWQWAEK